MSSVLSSLGMALDVAIVLFAFTLIIVIHELGHFVAARWAGIRVLAFAVGFGPALLSYRKGLGWRRGSSAGEYHALERHIDATTQRGWITLPGRPRPISPTEYRVNALPFGGYVKMLGQDDADPSAVSAESDGYQRCKPWKRMVVISAGVVFNTLSAAALFIIVFMAGLKTEPPVIGFVAPDSPAAAAVAVEAPQLNITSPGLRTGDRVVGVDGDRALSFKDIVLASAMARRGDAVTLTVQREGVPAPLTFRVVPREDPASGLLQFGVGPAISTTLLTSTHPSQREQIRKVLDTQGLTGVEPGMRLARINGQDITSPAGGGDLAILEAARASGGRPLALEFVAGGAANPADAGPPVTVTVPTVPRLDALIVQLDESADYALAHVAGLSTALSVESVADATAATGLRPGDVFAQIGAVEWPSAAAGIAEIRRNRSSTVPVVVARRTAPDGPWTLVDLKRLPVNAAGQIGFTLADPEAAPLFLGDWAGLPLAKSSALRPNTLSTLKLAPGTLISSVAGTPVKNLADLRIALAAAGAAADPGAASVTVELGVIEPRPDATGPFAAPPRTVAWSIDRSASSPDRASLDPVAWTTRAGVGLFEPEQFELRAASPVEAIAMGVRETRRVMLSTYVTFLRLFEGSVKVVHLKGPVGIAHMGAMLVDRGVVWLLFFAALVSVNLAVVNFLPIPITDGGHMVFLLYEQITGRPVSVQIQNAAAIVGLVLILGLFLIVTFNDITNLVTGR
jgi:regulator of sigma E protease